MLYLSPQAGWHLRFPFVKEDSKLPMIIFKKKKIFLNQQSSLMGLWELDEF